MFPRGFSRSVPAVCSYSVGSHCGLTVAPWAAWTRDVPVHPTVRALRQTDKKQGQGTQGRAVLTLQGPCEERRGGPRDGTEPPDRASRSMETCGRDGTSGPVGEGSTTQLGVHMRPKKIRLDCGFSKYLKIYRVKPRCENRVANVSEETEGLGPVSLGTEAQNPERRRVRRVRVKGASSVSQKHFEIGVGGVTDQRRSGRLCGVRPLSPGPWVATGGHSEGSCRGRGRQRGGRGCGWAAPSVCVLAKASGALRPSSLACPGTARPCLRGALSRWLGTGLDAGSLRRQVL